MRRLVFHHEQSFRATNLASVIHEHDSCRWQEVMRIHSIAKKIREVQHLELDSYFVEHAFFVVV